MDSSYGIDVEDDADEIYVEYEIIDCEVETKSYLIHQLQKTNDECGKLKNDLIMYNQMKIENGEIKRELNEIKNSRSYQSIQKLKKLVKK